MVSKILNEQYNNIQKIVMTNITPDYFQFKDDIVQDICVQLLTNKDKTITLYNAGQLNYYIVGLVKRGCSSSTSPFYYKYKKPAGVDSAIPEQAVYPDFEDPMIQLDEAELALLNHYVQTGSNLTTLSKEIGKNYYQTRKNILRLKKQFKL